jgi:hypothetical protein
MSVQQDPLQASAGAVWTLSSPSPLAAQIALCAAVLAIVAAGAALGGSSAQAALARSADPELVRLLRGMAAIKALTAAGVMAAVLWRLAEKVTLLSLGAYGLACGLLALGPLMIWSLAHLIGGVVTFYAGLLCALVMLARDPAAARRLKARLAALDARRPLRRP